MNEKKITELTKESLEHLDKIYQNIVGKCELDDIVGYFSLKTSLRPDRRLQIAHEGSLTKAIYVHLQTRSWLMEPRGIKYFGGSLAINDADIRALKTVATHSITTVMSKPERAVDEVFSISDREKLSEAIRSMRSCIGV
ncbi:Cfr10I/Bse634I family restriction endonuclease [Photobacterium leiognathi]|uniref:Cfr10I/Bse634I family restriction endonuclease n=1 Tax=Photobacterium leiognathi TaxID=553611 RepID=UPI000B19F5BF|nr:Cfr10I/Bse634I family restriction endonuclease [Photobacterium leiognathi]